MLIYQIPFLLNLNSPNYWNYLQDFDRSLFFPPFSLPSSSFVFSSSLYHLFCPGKDLHHCHRNHHLPSFSVFSFYFLSIKINTSKVTLLRPMIQVFFSIESNSVCYKKKKIHIFPVICCKQINTCNTFTSKIKKCKNVS